MADDKTLRELLHTQIDRGRNFLAREKLAPGMVKIFTRVTRNHLCKILPSDSPMVALFDPGNIGTTAAQHAECLASRLTALEFFVDEVDRIGQRTIASQRVFFGHGQSPDWRELKDFVSDRLGLPWDEFNREAVAGRTTFARLSEVLDSAAFAFLVMTGEDVASNNELQARQNVVHEVGLFQGRLGPTRAIVVLEQGCEEFSNIVGLSQIRFPRLRISTTFEEVRRVLEREGLI